MLRAVYRIRNLINGKVYVGSSSNIKERWACHQQQLVHGKHHSKHLQRSWNKYGQGAFIFEVLDVIPDLIDLLPAEQRHMDKSKVCDPKHGYNSVPLAGSNVGQVKSPELRSRISAAMKGRVFSEEHRRRIGEASAKYRHSDASKAKIREIALQRPHRPGTPCSNETRQKISEANSGERNHQWGKPLSEETRAKIGAKSKGKQTFLGRKHSEETKAKMRETMAGLVLSEDAKRRLGEANRGKTRSEEAKAKMRAAIAKRLGRPLEDGGHGVVHDEPDLGGLKDCGAASG